MKAGEVVEALGGRDLPVLGSTVTGLRALLRNEDKVSPREVSRVVLLDPMLTLKALRYAQEHRPARQSADITTVEHVVMMHGISRFLRTFSSLTAIESVLAKDAMALNGALRVVSRARHAAALARAIAWQRHDIESDEVIVAALLHDLAELLLWIHMPRQELEVRYLVENAAGLRSASAQRAVLGFTHVELQLALARAWDLPALFQRLMDDDHADHPRVVNVVAAASLARHLDHGWEDPALGDDYARVQKLLALPADTTYRLVRNAALTTARHWSDTGIRPVAAWLPLAGGRVVADGPALQPGGGIDLGFFRNALARLQDTDAALDADGAIVWALHALQFGLGLRRAMYARYVPGAHALRAHFVLDADAAPSAWVDFEAPIAGQDFFARVMARQQGLWAGSANREKLVPLLLPQQRDLFGAQDFLVMSLYSGNEPRGMLLADRGGLQAPIGDAMYAPFKALCETLGRRLWPEQAPQAAAPV